MKTAVSLPKDYLEFLRTSVPPFLEMKTALLRLDTIKGLREFYAAVLSAGKNSHSQIFQDLFVDFVFQQEREKTFLEFGATNGIEYSNSLMLEKERGWRGVLAEPDPQWREELTKNRPNSKIITDCVYSKSGEKMQFISSSIAVLSSLKTHARDDASGPLAENAKARFRDYREIDVLTISLNDVFENYLNGKPIEYMSVDTEGSELEILSHFDWEKYHPSVVTVEHNFTDSQGRLDELFSNNGYVRIFSLFTDVDAWYVLRDLAEKRDLI